MFDMVSLRERSIRRPFVAVWPLIVVAALVPLGCSGPFNAPTCAPGEAARDDGKCAPKPCGPAEVTSDTGECQPAGSSEAACPPGQLALEGGGCQPAGLPPDMACPPGQLALEGGGCQPAGLPPDMACPPGQLALEGGGCQPAGVPPEACGEGFISDGHGGCAAILPEEECPKGRMAIPGETRCREVAPCGAGTWGDIPIEANTQFVDLAYAGGDSDGTKARPWKKIQDAIEHAEDGATVAVAEGSYIEDVGIADKSVRLWGRCPDLVEIQGTGKGAGAIQVLTTAASGTEIRGLAVTGEGPGLIVSGARDVTIEQTWVHDMSSLGISAVDKHGPTSIALRNSLVERNHGIGVVVDAEATIEASVIRGTQPSDEVKLGGGISVLDVDNTGERADVAIRACLVEQNHDVGVLVSGSDATIEASVVRGTEHNSVTELGGGINIVDHEGERADVTVRACLVEQNQDVGVLVDGSDATIEASVVRGTQPSEDAKGGWGISVQQDSAAYGRADVTVRACLVEQNHEIGVFVSGSSATIEASVIRGTRPSSTAKGGRGIGVENDAETGGRADVTVRACLVEQNHEVGVFVSGSDAAIEASVIRDTQSSNNTSGGRGIGVQHGRETGERAKVAIRECLVEQNHEVGVYVDGSDATIEASVVRGTQSSDHATGGRGIGVQDYGETGERAAVTVRACLVERNHEVGVFVAGSDAAIEASVVRGTEPSEDGTGGRGINVQDDGETGERADVTVRACLVEQNHEIGVFVAGSDARIEASVVRGTEPSEDGTGGRGINVQDDGETGERADVTVRVCLVEQNHDVGMFVASSDATIEGTILRATQPNVVRATQPQLDVDDQGGIGLGVVGTRATGQRASVAVRGCLVEENHQSGVVISHSDARIDASIVRTTKALANAFGDGIDVDSGTAIIENATINGNTRAGVASFGSKVTILDATLFCNAFELNYESSNGVEGNFEDSERWQCTRRDAKHCAEIDGSCRALSAGLKPPPSPASASSLP
ncbi:MULTISPECIES: right-handed parallel beta-helix repeat-containing protein [Sorangium]|nr:MULTISPECIES: right-handed parallel beta-helix repeat-containing protein [Sorangium]